MGVKKKFTKIKSKLLKNILRLSGISLASLIIQACYGVGTPPLEPLDAVEVYGKLFTSDSLPLNGTVSLKLNDNIIDQRHTDSSHYHLYLYNLRSSNDTLYYLSAESFGYQSLDTTITVPLMIYYEKEINIYLKPISAE